MGCKADTCHSDVPKQINMTNISFWLLVSQYHATDGDNVNNNTRSRKKGGGDPIIPVYIDSVI